MLLAIPIAHSLADFYFHIPVSYSISILPSIPASRFRFSFKPPSSPFPCFPRASSQRRHNCGNDVVYQIGRAADDGEDEGECEKKANRIGSNQNANRIENPKAK